MTDLLIVVDMQRDFVSGALGSAEARAIVPAVCARIRRAKEENTPVIFTLDTHEEDYMETREGRFLPVPHCIRGTEGWTLEPQIAQECARGMLSFEKPTFGSTQLTQHVAALAAERSAVNGKGMTIELCGVCTDICVVSNALLIKAMLPEADLVVDSALCAGVTPEKHEAALETMRSCQIAVL
ncbi:MAG: cysteine hydrolase [Clostridia bacterium]|nr:cysteine hydrolase [Clostridia bacterium]